MGVVSKAPDQKLALLVKSLCTNQPFKPSVKSISTLVFDPVLTDKNLAGGSWPARSSATWAFISAHALLFSVVGEQPSLEDQSRFILMKTHCLAALPDEIKLQGRDWLRTGANGKYTTFSIDSVNTG
jgi:hypothetical protein